MKYWKQSKFVSKVIFIVSKSTKKNILTGLVFEVWNVNKKPSCLSHYNNRNSIRVVHVLVWYLRLQKGIKRYGRPCNSEHRNKKKWSRLKNLWKIEFPLILWKIKKISNFLNGSFISNLKNQACNNNKNVFRIFLHLSRPQLSSSHFKTTPVFFSFQIMYTVICPISK